MKRISILLASVFGLMALTTSCNDEWTEEQYEHYISFKAPLDEDGGVTSIYVPFTRKGLNGTTEIGKSNYLLPMIVSGTTKNDRNFSVKVTHDTDTLDILNYERFQNRKELFYVDMNDYATYPSTVQFKAGKDVSLLDIHFDFLKDGQSIDMVEKWVLPIMVEDDGTSPYLSHPRKHYGKAMLRVFPYNDYSGNYSATTLLISQSPDKAGLGKEPSGQETVRAYVVSDDEIFFYAGIIDETREDRKNYKVYAKFIPSVDLDGNPLNSGKVELRCDNPDMKFEKVSDATYTIYDKMDDLKPFLKHHYVIINDINYSFVDYTLGKDLTMWYQCTGTLTLERQINTQIPDDDQAIEW